MAIYSKCPKCGEKADRFSNLDPITEQEAAVIMFELYYERRCEKLGIPADGPLPKHYEQALPAPRSMVG
jgi:hypothetical protein